MGVFLLYRPRSHRSASSSSGSSALLWFALPRQTKKNNGREEQEHETRDESDGERFNGSCPLISLRPIRTPLPAILQPCKTQVKDKQDRSFFSQQDLPVRSTSPLQTRKRCSLHSFPFPSPTLSTDQSQPARDPISSFRPFLLCSGNGHGKALRNAPQEKFCVPLLRIHGHLLPGWNDLALPKWSSSARRNVCNREASRSTSVGSLPRASAPPAPLRFIQMSSARLSNVMTDLFFVPSLFPLTGPLHVHLGKTPLQ